MRAVSNEPHASRITYSEQVDKRDPFAKNAAPIRRSLLEWYYRHHRNLPWREAAIPTQSGSSRIMLQQTRVAVVIERYRAFLKRFPTVTALARAREDDVLTLWSGLGYYRRARMLLKAAQHVTAELAVAFPALPLIAEAAWSRRIYVGGNCEHREW